MEKDVKCTFAKLDDGWGIRAPLNSLSMGDIVVVERADGKCKRVTVGGKVTDDRNAFMGYNKRNGASYYRIKR